MIVGTTTETGVNIDHVIKRSTVLRISWNSEPESIVRITDVGQDLPSSGSITMRVSSTKTILITSTDKKGASSSRSINIYYLPD